jgi:alpha-tubulin suppressor-like RCC1 family protein
VRATSGRTVLAERADVGSLVIQGSAHVEVGAAWLNVEDTFETIENGTLGMTDPDGVVYVFGNARFAGGSTGGRLTQGQIYVVGNFEQAVNPQAYQPDPDHETLFLGATDNSITFAHPSTSSAGSFFGSVTIAAGQPRTTSLNSDVVALGGLWTPGAENAASFTSALSGSPLLTSAGAGVADLAFNNVRWRIIDGFLADTLARVTFTGMNILDGSPQLQIDQSSGTVTLADFVFDQVSAADFLGVSDPDGEANGFFGVTMVNPSPAFHGGRISASGGATIANWFAEPDFTWVGGEGADWTNPLNWAGGVVPGENDIAVFPAEFGGLPDIPTGTTLRGLISQPGAPQLTAAGTLTITERLEVPYSESSSIACASPSARLFFSAVTQVQFAGSVSCSVEMLSGETLLIGDARADSVVVSGSAVLDVDVHTLTVDSTFRTIDSGVLRMTQDVSGLVVGGLVSFEGGSTTGLLTGGTLIAGNGFNQAGSATSFNASGAHTTLITNSTDFPDSPVTIGFANPDSSGFRRLEITAINTRIPETVSVRGNIELLSEVILSGAGGSTGGELRIGGNLSGSPSSSISVARVRIGGAFFHEGAYNTDTTFFTGSAQVIPAILGSEVANWSNVVVTGSARAEYATTDEWLTINGGLIIRESGSFQVSGPGSFGRVTVSGALRTEDNGVLRMQHANAAMEVIGDALFNGGSTAGMLTAGTIEFLSNFEQRADNSPSSYQASGPHFSHFPEYEVPRTVRFANPGFGASESRFSQWQVSGPNSTLVLESDAYAAAQFYNTSGGAVAVETPEGEFHRIYSAGASGGNLTFTRVGWTIDGSVSIGGTLTNVAFEDQDPTWVQWRIANPGSAVVDTIRVIGPSFGTVPTTGRYLEIEDLAEDDFPLTVIVTGSTPAFHSGFAAVLGGATLTGWSAFESSIALSDTSLSFIAFEGSSSPPSQQITISNAGTGTLTNLSLGTVTYALGEPTDWLVLVALDSTTAPTTFSVTPTLGLLGVGTYTATVPVLSSVAGNSPQLLTITFEIIAPSEPLLMQVTTGSNHNCAIGGDDGVYCSGFNSGRLGDGTTTQRLSPVAASLPGGVTAVDVAGGGDHSCAVTATGAAYCWGSNASGQLGNGTQTTSTSPVPVSTSDGVQFVQLASGNSFTCGVTTVGTAYCWGANASGQLGDGGTTLSTTPVQVPNPNNELFSQVAAGFSHACAVTHTGAAYCWGSGANGRLGTGSIETALSPVAVSLPEGVRFRHISAGGNHSCAVSTTDIGFCWGSGGFGQIGDGAFTQRNTPTQISGGLTFTQVWAGTFGTAASCGIVTTGAVYCWGGNASGGSGDGTLLTASTPRLALTPAGLTFTQVATSNGSTCAFTSSGTPYCWGNNAEGQLGIGTTSIVRVPVEVQMPSGVTQVAAGFTQTCGAAADGTGYCWGNNDFGKLGDGTTVARVTPAIVVGTPSISLTQTVTWRDHSCALSTTGEVLCWGFGGSGRLGYGGTLNQASPVSVTLGGGVTASAVTVGNAHSCALIDAGGAVCWGFNSSGQLGNGTTTQSTTPIAVTMPDGVSFVQLEAGSSHTCGLSSTGSIYCWGSNSFGQLGVNSLSSSTIPTLAVQPEGVVFAFISTGMSHTCAVATNGDAYCWGLNQNGQLGDGSSTNQLVPTRVSGTASFTRIAAGDSHSCATTATGTAFCWGFNIVGQLGTGGGASSTTPVAVSLPVGTSFSTITAGSSHSCATSSQGPTYCWGWNNGSQLGNGYDAYAIRLFPTP